MSTRKDNDSLNTKWWIGDKLCPVTVETGPSVLITRLDITAGLPER
jgi:hypothetical protein